MAIRSLRFASEDSTWTASTRRPTCSARARRRGGRPWTRAEPVRAVDGAARPPPPLSRHLPRRTDVQPARRRRHGKGRSRWDLAGHLEPDGAALVPLFVPTPTPEDRFGVTREHVTDDGRVQRVCAVSETRDEEQRLQVTVLRYESTAQRRDRGTRTPLAAATGTRSKASRRWLPPPGSPSPRSSVRPGEPASSDASAFVFLPDELRVHGGVIAPN